MYSCIADIHSDPQLDRSGSSLATSARSSNTVANMRMLAVVVVVVVVAIVIVSRMCSRHQTF